MAAGVSLLVAGVCVVSADSPSFAADTTGSDAAFASTTDAGLSILSDFTEESGVSPVDGGGSGTVAVSDVTSTGLVVSLPRSGDGIAWMDDPYGYDLGLGLPSASTREERYCPVNGWFLQDESCVKRIAFAYVYTPFVYEFEDFEYDYRDYTYTHLPYVYDLLDYTYHREIVGYQPHSHAYAADIAQSTGTLCPWGGSPNAQGDLCIVDDGETPVYGDVLDDTPDGWEDTGTNWRRLQGTPAGWEDTGEDWQQRDQTPAGWEDVDGQWRKLIDVPGWQNTGTDWRRLINKPGWTATDGRWRHLAPTPSGFVIDDTSWVTTIPARTRTVGADLPPAADTSTAIVINAAPATPDWSEAGEREPISVADEAGIASGATATVLDDGTSVYDSGSDAGSVAGQVLSDGSLRLAVTIPDELAPRSFEVPLHMPDFMAPALQPDGRVLIVALVATDNPYSTAIEPDRWEVEFEMAAPWAKDAHGNNVTTWYTLDGTTLTQHIAPTDSTVFPVVADPTAKQVKQAAVARKAAATAEQASSRAQKSANAAGAAAAVAAERKLAAQQALVLAQQQRRDKLEAAQAAKKAAAEARAAEKAAREAAAKASKEAARAEKEAKKASKAAASEILAKSKKLQAEAKKLAATANASAKAADRADVKAQRAATSATALLPEIKAAASTAVRVEAVYEQASSSAAAKEAAAQKLLNAYVATLDKRIVDAIAQTPAVVPAGGKLAVPKVFNLWGKNQTESNPRWWAGQLECAPNIVIGARGSGQPWNEKYGVGDKIMAVGEEMGRATNFKGRTEMVAVKYAAPAVPTNPSDFAPYARASQSGSALATQLVEDVAKLCMGSRIHLIGYSSGAWVLGGTFANSAWRERIGSAILIAYPAASPDDAVRVMDPELGVWREQPTTGLATKLGWAIHASAPEPLAQGALSATDRSHVVEVCVTDDFVCDVGVRAGIFAGWGMLFGGSRHSSNYYEDWVKSHLQYLDPK